ACRPLARRPGRRAGRYETQRCRPEVEKGSSQDDPSSLLLATSRRGTSSAGEVFDQVGNLLRGHVVQLVFAVLVGELQHEGHLLVAGWPVWVAHAATPVTTPRRPSI